MSLPTSGSKNEARKQVTSTLVSCLAYSSALKMEATCSSATQLTFNGLHGVISQKIEFSFGEKVFRKFGKIFNIIGVYMEHSYTYNVILNYCRDFRGL
jgi:hypothetical protein